jgi:hypothetical protein
MEQVAKHSCVIICLLFPSFFFFFFLSLSLVFLICVATPLALHFVLCLPHGGVNCELIPYCDEDENKSLLEVGPKLVHFVGECVSVSRPLRLKLCRKTEY